MNELYPHEPTLEPGAHASCWTVGDGVVHLLLDLTALSDLISVMDRGIVLDDYDAGNRSLLHVLQAHYESMLRRATSDARPSPP